MEKKVMSQMKMHFFGSSDPISSIEFVTTFNLASCINRIQEGATICEYLFSVKTAKASTLNNRISAATHITSAAASVQSAERLRKKKLLRAYSEVVNYLVKKFANYQAIAEMESAIL